MSSALLSKCGIWSELEGGGGEGDKEGEDGGNRMDLHCGLRRWSSGQGG